MRFRVPLFLSSTPRHALETTPVRSPLPFPIPLLVPGHFQLSSGRDRSTRMTFRGDERGAGNDVVGMPRDLAGSTRCRFTLICLPFYIGHTFQKQKQ